jgi:hypothetical protein
VADVFSGRRKENMSPNKHDRHAREVTNSASPLGERHINSPPAPKRITTKTGEENARPPARPGHKKSGSSVSLKTLLMGKDKASATGSVSSTDGQAAEKMLKKTKSATNIAGLLKKKSKKDLKEDVGRAESQSPTKSRPVERSTPIWEQFATQPLATPEGNMMYPASQKQTLQQEIDLYTPKDYSEYKPAEQRNFHGMAPTTPSSLDYKPPQRPFLEHKSSRSSIFTENIDDYDNDELKRPRSRDHATSRASCSGTPVAARPPLQTRSTDPPATDGKNKRGSKVFDAIQNFNMKTRKDDRLTPQTSHSTSPPLSPQELDSAFEKVLDSLNIPHNMRDNMRNLKPDVKAGLMKGERVGSGSSTGSGPATEVRSSARSPQKKENERPKSEGEDSKDGKRPRSRSRPRSRIFTMSKRDEAPPESTDRPASSSRSRSKSRTKSADLNNCKPTLTKAMSSTVSLASLHPADSSATPGDYIHYLREVQKPALVEVGKLHKLRILLRNESISWTDHFVSKGGMDELVQLFYRISKIEWREEHEDNLLHETLLCLKALSTTSLALQRLDQIQNEFFPALLQMLFDPEKKGPSEFTTRGVIVSLLFAHLSAVIGSSPEETQKRAMTVLNFLKDPKPENDKQPLDFVSQMHTPRPYRIWCKEVVNVTKEVFWIFLHHMTVVPILEVDESVGFCRAHYPAPRPPHPAAPYVGGVEWEATQYLAIHLDLLNGVLACIPTHEARNALREDLRQSGFEKAMGGSLRTCKEKFYGGVHDGLKCWVSAAKADSWPVEYVRAGPPRDQASPRKSPVKKKGDEPPKIDLDVGGKKENVKGDDGWL